MMPCERLTAFNVTRVQEVLSFTGNREVEPAAVWEREQVESILFIQPDVIKVPQGFKICDALWPLTLSSNNRISLFSCILL